MTKKNLWLGLLAITLVFTMTVVGCDNDTTDNKDGSWRIKKTISYTVTNGEASVSSESVYNWITYRNTSDTNFEYKYTTGSYTYHGTRNGQNYTYTSETISETYSSTSTTTIIYDSAGKQLQSTSESTTTTTSGTSTTQTTTYYDSASGLTSRQTSSSTTNYSGTTSTSTSEITYNIELLSDSDGVKTYKSSYSSIISNGTSIDISTQGYTEYKIQDGRTLEQKSFTAAGVLSSTTTYTLSDNAVIKAKLGNYTLTSQTSGSSTYNSYSTVEVLSDSATELVIRNKTFTNDVLSSQYDNYYEKVN